jgi:TonB family protein
VVGSPRYRDHSTPLILWICAAVCAHYLFAQGGGEVAQKHEDHSFLAELGAEARERTRQEEQTFEVYPNEAPLSPDAPAPEAPPPPPPEPVKKPEEKKKPPEPVKKPPEEKKVEDKSKPLPVKKDDTKPEPPKPPPPIDQRIAVRQHVKPDQKDNPTAQFIADQANKVDKETVAQQTSHDQDAPDPTPGGHHSGPTQKPGDSDQTKIADSDEHKGEKNKAPGEKGTEFEVQHNARYAASGSNSPAGGAPSSPSNPAEANPAGQSGPAAPDSDQAAASNWTFNRNAPGGATGNASDPAHHSPSEKSGHTAFLGLGQAGAPGQVNLNLSQSGLVATVGQDQLRKERENDGERRLSQHRGSWQSSSFDKWRNAIENYVTSVKPGNQTALNAAAVPFATYLNGMHNRIHPLFADSFLGSLDALPPSHPLNDKKLLTSLEIVVSKDGHVKKMGIVKTSGITAFDVAALDAVNRAQPFGPAPSAIISPDGNVYLHWEFHRDEVFACSTMNARPFMLKGGEAPPAVQPGLPGQAPVKSPEGVPPSININTHESSTGMKEPLPGLAPVAPLARAGKT